MRALAWGLVHVGWLLGLALWGAWFLVMETCCLLLVCAGWELPGTFWALLNTRPRRPVICDGWITQKEVN